MEIRLAESRDIPGITGLLYQVGGVHHDIRPDIFRAGAVKYTPAELEALLKERDKPIFVCADGDRVLGHCFCLLRRFRDSTVMTDRKELYIDDLCVDESCRGRHIGSMLYGHVLAFARENGCGFVTLNVWSGNEAAMKFYENAGLKPRSITMDVAL